MPEALKIVLPTDFSAHSEAAVDWVKRLSERGHAEVHCVNVVQQPMMYMPVMSGTAMASMPTVDQLETLAGESLENFVTKHLGDLKTPAVAKVLVGQPADEITGYAKSVGAQMIVIATRGQSGLAHILLGSTAEGVVRNADCAVLTVR